jgi:hypothetical protein
MFLKIISHIINSSLLSISIAKMGYSMAYKPAATVMKLLLYKKANQDK